jgi:hypothetical protein
MTSIGMRCRDAFEMADFSAGSRLDPMAADGELEDKALSFEVDRCRGGAVGGAGRRVREAVAVDQEPRAGRICAAPIPTRRTPTPRKMNRPSDQVPVSLFMGFRSVVAGGQCM